MPSLILASARSISSTAAWAWALERQVALALDGERVALARLLVELHVARLPLGHEHVGLGLQRLRLAGVGDPLLLERLRPGPSRNLSSGPLRLRRRLLGDLPAARRRPGASAATPPASRRPWRAPSWPEPSSPARPSWRPAPSWRGRPSWREPSSAAASAFFADRLLGGGLGGVGRLLGRCLGGRRGLLGGRLGRRCHACGAVLSAPGVPKGCGIVGTPPLGTSKPADGTGEAAPRSAAAPPRRMSPIMFAPLPDKPDHDALERAVLDRWEQRADLRPAPRQERRRAPVQLHRRPGHRQQDARRAHGLGPHAQGRVPALQGAPRLPPALPERLRLPGPLDRGRRRARARASTRSARSRSSAWPSSHGAAGPWWRSRRPSSPTGSIRLGPVDGLGPRLLHVLRHEHRVHLALPGDRRRSGAGSTGATAPPSGAPAAARRSRPTSWPAATSTARTRRSRCASRCSTVPGQAIVIWTTTPWTLPANVAAAVSPTADYGRLANGDWLAVERSEGPFEETVAGRGPGRPPLRRPLRRARARRRGRPPRDRVGRGVPRGGHRHRPHRARAAAPRTSS